MKITILAIILISGIVHTKTQRTAFQEENKKLRQHMTEIKGRLADLEARNAQLEKQYTDLLREYEFKESGHASEIANYQKEIAKLRSEIESILVDLQTLMDAKLSLELEIAAYRKLLESKGSRNRNNEGLEQTGSS